MQATGVCGPPSWARRTLLGCLFVVQRPSFRLGPIVNVTNRNRLYGPVHGSVSAPAHGPAAGASEGGAAGPPLGSTAVHPASAQQPAAVHPAGLRGLLVDVGWGLLIAALLVVLLLWGGGADRGFIYVDF